MFGTGFQHWVLSCLSWPYPPPSRGASDESDSAHFAAAVWPPWRQLHPDDADGGALGWPNAHVPRQILAGKLAGRLRRMAEAILQSAAAPQRGAVGPETWLGRWPPPGRIASFSVLDHWA